MRLFWILFFLFSSPLYAQSIPPIHSYQDYRDIMGDVVTKEPCLMSLVEDHDIKRVEMIFLLHAVHIDQIPLARFCAKGQPKTFSQVMDMADIFTHFADEMSGRLEWGRHVPFFETRVIDGFGYIKIPNFFTWEASLWLMPILQKFESEQVQGILIDLQSNLGGYAGEASNIAGIFLGDVLLKYVSTPYRQINFMPYRTSMNGSSWSRTVPLAVLVDQYSISASEVLVGALQYYDRAVIVGKQTSGKGTSQSAIRLHNGRILLLTTDYWFLPNKQSVHGVGLTPDIELHEPNPISEAIEILREHAIKNTR